MSGSLIIVLIIVVWLFVLAPLLLRGQKPIRKAGEAFDDTRVVYEGGSGGVPPRRRPRLRPGDARHPEDDGDDEDYEVVTADPEEDGARDVRTVRSEGADWGHGADGADGVDDVLIDDAPPGSRPRGLFARRGSSGDAGKAEGAGEHVDGDVVDGEVVHELEPTRGSTAVSVLDDGETVTARVEPVEDETPEPERGVETVQQPVAEDAYDYDSSYVSPGDMLYPGPEDTTAEPSDPPGGGQTRSSAARFEELSDDDLSDEEIAFAERRRGRGGWDPVADAEHSLTRYQRRQRTLIGLIAAVVVTGVLAVVLGGWFWVAPGLAAALTVLYLGALRSQVRQEQALRSRRIRQLRRARLGVRQAGHESVGRELPGRLRRPGAVVLELDDESPDFTDLPTTRIPFERDSGDDGYGGYGDLRRAG